MPDISPRAPMDWNVSEIVLERLKYAVSKDIGPQVMESVRIEQFAGMVANDMLLTLTAELLAEKIESQEITERVTVVHDFAMLDGRVQRWKDRHWKRWWCRWLFFGQAPRRVYDSKSTEVVLKVTADDYASFPQMTWVPPPTFGPVVFKRVTRHQTEEWDA